MERLPVRLASDSADSPHRHKRQRGFTVLAADQRGPHMLGIEVPREVAQILGQRLAERSVVASVRGSSLRIAPICTLLKMT